MDNNENNKGIPTISNHSTIAALREKYDLHMKVERYISDEYEVDKEFIRK